MVDHNGLARPKPHYSKQAATIARLSELGKSLHVCVMISFDGLVLRVLINP